MKFRRAKIDTTVKTEETTPTQDKHEKKKLAMAKWHAHRRKFDITGMSKPERKLWAKVTYNQEKQSIGKIYTALWNFKHPDLSKKGQKKDIIDKMKKDLVGYVMPGSPLEVDSSDVPVESDGPEVQTIDDKIK